MYEIETEIINKSKFKKMRLNSYSKKQSIETFNIFIELCKNSNIDVDYRKFHYFCNRASYFNVRDKKFYEYAPMELQHRCSYSIDEMFIKFTDWNNGKKHYLCWNKEYPEFPERVEAESSNQAKYRYSKSNSINYIQTGGQVAYQNCL